MTIRWTESAANDLFSIVAFIHSESPHHARRVAARVNQATDSLEQLPNRGRPGREPGTRELVLSGTPYIIVYRVKDECVELLHIHHGRTDWWNT